MADPTPEACKEILQFAETFCSGLTIGLQEIVQEELQLALPEVSFNQILFLGRFAVKEKGHVYSKELNLVVKTVKNAVTNTPNVTISDDLVKRLPDPERTLKKYEYDLLPTEMLEDNAHDLGAFHSLMPPIEETTRELAKEGLVFGVIPDIGTVLYRETDIRHIISILQKEGCCHVTGLYGVGKTAVGIGILKELAKSGVSCLWFNCWKLLSFEYLTHVVAHIFGRLGEDSSFVIESLKYVDPEAGWEERFGILLRALTSAQREFCIILDNFNSLDLDSHTRKFFDFAADYLLSGSTLLGKLSIVYITTRGHSGYRQIPEGQFPPKVTHTIEGLPANKLMNCLKEYFPDINLDLADTLVTYVTQNLKLLKMLCGHITSRHMDPNSVFTRMRKGRDNGSGCDHFLFSWLYEQLDEQEQNEMRFAVQFRPLFSAELLASIVKKEKWKCRKSLEELSRQLCCLERYECEGREEWLYKTVYRVPPEFQEEVVSDDDKPSAGLIEKAADFFVADVKDIQIPRAKIREYYFRIYRAYRYAVFFIGEAGDRLKHFELAKRFWSVLIENGVVAELRNDLKECQEAVGKHGKPEQKVDMYMMWNRLWRILFRMELYRKNLQEMQKFLSDLPRRERLPYFTNSYQVEQGIYLTMLRDYANALPIFKRQSLSVLRSYDATRISRKPVFRAVTSAIGKLTGYSRRDRSSKMEIKNERILYTLRLRTAQTLISLNRPLEAKTLLKSFELPDQIWNSLAEWHSTDLKDIEHIWYELLDGYILRHHGSEGFPTQDTYLGIMSSRLGELYAKLKNEVSSERDRTVLHSFAMFMRHHTTLYFLEYKGKEALISSLLCYMFNDQILGDQTGRGVCCPASIIISLQ